MIPALQGFAAAVLSELDAAGVASVAAELASLERLVASEPALAAALTDTGLAPAVRRAVATDLLATRLGAVSLRLVAEAITVVPAQEVPMAISWMANRARLSADRTYLEEPLSAMAGRRRVGGFAAAVFANLSIDELTTVGSELFQVARLISATSAVRAALGDRELPAEARSAFLRGLLEGEASAATVAISAYVPLGGRARDVVGTLDYLVVQAAQHRGWRVARVQSGAPLDDAQRAALSASLEQLAHHPVELNVTVDEALLAGIIVEIGDLRLDDSLRGRLEVLREHVATSKHQFVSQLTTNEGAS
jgi:F-type H+-transporting ATPase subunit delta